MTLILLSKNFKNSYMTGPDWAFAKRLIERGKIKYPSFGTLEISKFSFFI